MQAFVVMKRLISQSPETQNRAQQNDSPEGRPAQQLTKTAQVRASLCTDFKITYVEIRCLVTCQDTQYRLGVLRGIDAVDIRSPLVKIGREGIVIQPVHAPLIFVSCPTNERWQPRKG